MTEPVVTSERLTIISRAKNLQSQRPAIKINTCQDSECHLFAVLIKALGNPTDCFSKLQFLDTERGGAYSVGENLDRESLLMVIPSICAVCALEYHLNSSAHQCRIYETWSLMDCGTTLHI